MTAPITGLRSILAANLKAHRRILGLTQEKLAELADISWQTVNSIECRRAWVSEHTLTKLADALKIDPYQLLLPPKTGTLGPHETLRRLIKAKRAFDDSFSEILNQEKR